MRSMDPILHARPGLRPVSLLSRKVQIINFTRYRQNLRCECVTFMGDVESISPACRGMHETIIAERVCLRYARFPVCIRKRNACTEDASPIAGHHTAADGYG